MIFNPERIDTLLETQGRKQDWLAQVTGYSPGQVSRILNGHEPVTEEFAQRAARHLGVPIEWLTEAVPA